MKRLQGMDALFLHTETATQYMHTLKVAIFEPPADGSPYSFADQMEHIASTIHRVPPFRWKALPIPFNLHNPIWITDPHFDLALHVHRAALPAPAGSDQLAEFIENIASTPLNRERPLWDLWMVENYLGDKIAAVSKVHHALADGVATAELLEDFMTPEAGAEIPAPPPLAIEQPPPLWRMLGAALVDLIRDLVRIPAKVMAVRAAKAHQKERNLSPEERPPEPYSAPFTLLNRPISSHRKFNFFTVPLARVKAVSAAYGVTINDVVMNMAAQAVREYLIEHNDLPSQSLTASIPISTRGKEAEHTYGNKVGSLCVSLCTDIADPVARLQAIHAAMAASKLDFEDTAGGRAADVVGLLPPVLVRAIGSYSRRLSMQGKSPSYNLIVSNVPGPRGELFDDYLAMSEFYSIGPILEGIGLNITAWSFRDNLSFSILSCVRAVPDPGVIRTGLIRALDDMENAQNNSQGDHGERAAT
ncbi:wax ester/triacylglycerol synthase family O-acyltransferase [Halieaceae bacterium IMCC14734]|uniref:diacylglycerol O-acyltransferase n=1 Tax=Candidatus Litorirhabdus singularis TaxID=2518993 RepID=A0ABT3TI62_9GAMM|nr:wax ester/triacylglycerol synthase family O-acyltransferase [Candidatus Litorirhabdus singularis]MCX2982017.1 wax ester/triacylglycerol synthase family O-acyltransferase [Candidatus Litorirhabdus singularis]